jgi:transglutaminase-like putative cysteine protease
MITYRVIHRTEYRYGEEVTSSHTVACLLPRGTPHQQVHAATVDVVPPAEHRAEHDDAFGNRVSYLAVQHPHEALVITARSEVTIEPLASWAGGAALPPWEEVARAVRADTSSEGLLARECTLDSPLVSRGDELVAFARPSFPPGRPVGEALADLSGRIFREFTFDPAFSDVSTPLAEVLEHRRGVCQDFAHLAIGCLRSLGLPARYVSGYIETDPPPGQERLVGSDASHAWCSVYVPGFGWCDLDPTNHHVPPQRHVTVAWGRDYGDVAPVRGVVFGPSTRQDLAVSVDVVRIPGPPDLTPL